MITYTLFLIAKNGKRSSQVGREFSVDDIYILESSSEFTIT